MTTVASKTIYDIIADNVERFPTRPPEQITFLIIQEIKEKDWKVTVAPLIMAEVQNKLRVSAARQEKKSWNGAPDPSSFDNDTYEAGQDDLDIRDADDLDFAPPGPSKLSGPRPSPNPSSPKVVVHNRDYSAWVAEFSDLFNVPFVPKRGAKKVLWGTADIDDHQVRMDFLLQQAEGTFATANRHAKAIDYCKKAGVRRLVDLPKGDKS